MNFYITSVNQYHEKEHRKQQFLSDKWQKSSGIHCIRKFYVIVRLAPFF